MRPAADSPKLAFAFPGVGVALTGHELAFVGRHERTVMPLLAEASERAREDLVAWLLEAAPLCAAARQAPGSAPRAAGPRALAPLAAQLFAYAFGCAAAAAYRSRGLEPALVAGHSLGLYAALHAAGAVSFRDGLTITETAHRLGTEHCASGIHDLAAIVGLSRAELDALLHASDLGSLCIVNANGPSSLVVAGLTSELEKLVAVALDEGAIKAVRLEVDLPYHHPGLLAPVAAGLRAALGRIGWQEPRCPVVSCVDGSLVRSAAQLCELTAQNIATPMDWLGVVRAMARAEVELVLECGAGHSLSQNARLIDSSPKFLSLKQAESRLAT